MGPEERGKNTSRRAGRQNVHTDLCVTLIRKKNVKERVSRKKAEGKVLINTDLGL